MPTDAKSDQGVRVAVAGGSELYRECLRLALEAADTDLHVTNAGSVDEGIRRFADSGEVDVFLVNAEVTAKECKSCLDDVSSLYNERHDVAVVMLCGSGLCFRARLAVTQGLAGMVDSTATVGLLAAALRVVGAGGTCFSASIVGEGRLGTARSDSRTLTLPQLSPRQQEVLSLLCEGKSNKEMSRVLNLTESTVKAHISGILKRLNANSRTQAVLIASRFAETDVTNVPH